MDSVDGLEAARRHALGAFDAVCRPTDDLTRSLADARTRVLEGVADSRTAADALTVAEYDHDECDAVAAAAASAADALAAACDRVRTAGVPAADFALADILADARTQANALSHSHDYLSPFDMGIRASADSAARLYDCIRGVADAIASATHVPDERASSAATRAHPLVTPLATGLLGMTVRLLPRADQARYTEELSSELWERAVDGAGRWRQLTCAVRMLTRIYELRAPLRRSALRRASP